ncbi:metalloprotease [Phellopilus nigrolimitatus]|nr:metalloprotease [Phellopilus nigrolimitatus]
MLRLPILYLALFAASAVLASEPASDAELPSDTEECGSVVSVEELALAEKDFQDKLASEDKNGVGAHVLASQNAVVPIYWNVIYADNTPTGGNLSDATIAAQVALANQAYSGSGLSFTLARVKRVQNKYWFGTVDSAQDVPQLDMKRQLRYNGSAAAALNVYSLGFQNSTKKGLYGQATFPWKYKNDPVRDGLMIRYSVLPGGTVNGKNLGKTFVHETGHWVGLYHTFQGGCPPPGDSVADTAPQKNASASRSCPVGHVSCPGGLPDPVHNFMDYSNDTCRTEFTPGQIQRFKDQLRLYRNITV